MIAAVPARWAHPRDAKGRYIPQDPPPVILYLDIDDVLNDDMWLRRSDVKSAYLALFEALPSTLAAARKAYAAVAIDPERASKVAAVVRDTGAQVWVCSAWRRALGVEATVDALAVHGIAAQCLPHKLSSTRVHDIRRHLLDLPAETLAAVLDDQVDAPLMEGVPVACVTPVDGVSDDGITALRRALSVAWVAYEAGRPVSARCATREQLVAWLAHNVASADLVEQSALADPPPPTRPPTLWERIAIHLASSPGLTVAQLATALDARTGSVAQALRMHGAEVSRAGAKGAYTYGLGQSGLGVPCEGCPTVEATTRDSDGVPLCDACHDALDAC